MFAKNVRAGELIQASDGHRCASSMLATMKKSHEAHRKVLILEEEPSLRNSLLTLLATLGCEADVAYNGNQVIDMIWARSSTQCCLIFAVLMFRPKKSCPAFSPSDPAY